MNSIGRWVFSCGFLVAFLLVSLLPATAENGNFQEALQHYFQEDYERARDVFTKAARNDTGSARVQFFLGNTLNRLGDTTGAVKQFRKTLSLRPGHQSARRKLAEILFEAERWPRAIEEYRYLVERNPETFQFHYRLGLALFRTGKLTKAKERFLRSKRLNPESAEAHYYLGRILMKNREFLNAASRFSRALELDPSQGRYYFQRGLAHFREEDYRNRNDNNWTSASDFKKAIEEGFDSPKTVFMYANSLLNRGLYYHEHDRQTEGVKLLKRSIRQYRRVLATDWKASNAFHNMGVAYLVIGKLDHARQSVEKAILTEPSTLFFHDTLGEIYFQLGRFNKAIESWNLAQELDSDYETHPFEPMIMERSIESRIEESKLRR